MYGVSSTGYVLRCSSAAAVHCPSAATTSRAGAVSAPAGYVAVPLPPAMPAEQQKRLMAEARRDSVPPLPERHAVDDKTLSNLLAAEQRCPASDMWQLQRHLRPHMRRIVASWMFDVCMEHRGAAQRPEERGAVLEVFALAVNILDRFLCIEQIFDNQLQCLATVCLFVASKVKLPTPFNAQILSQYTDRSVSVSQILTWELLVLGRLNWDVSAVTALDFIEPLIARCQLESSVASVLRCGAHSVLPEICKEYDLAILSASVQAALSLQAAARSSSFGAPLLERVHCMLSRVLSYTPDYLLRLVEMRKASGACGYASALGGTKQTTCAGAVRSEAEPLRGRANDDVTVTGHVTPVNRHTGLLMLLQQTGYVKVEPAAVAFNSVTPTDLFDVAQ